MPTLLPPSRPPRLLPALWVVAAWASPAGAQGPAQPSDPPPAVVRSTPGAGSSQLEANIARLTSTGVPRLEASRPKPFRAWSESAQALRDSIIVSVARTAVGTRYVRGGQSVGRGLDCSGLVRYVMSAFDVAVPRTAAQQAGSGIGLGRDTTRLRPGDLLTFGRDAGISHVGIYVGNGRYVHASSVAGRVIESEIRRPRTPLVKPWRGTRRLLLHGDADSSSTGGS